MLDYPEHKELLLKKLRDLSLLYRFPVRLAVMSTNGGYARATNAGASLAKSGQLVLMNSDVAPVTKGWLPAMLNAYNNAHDNKIGIIGPKLLYEDGGLQHAGMYFEIDTKYAFYGNKHYFKGYPSGFAAANVSRTVPAVTGACMMLSRDLYKQLNGLSTDYVVGDFEDSDLCLRAYKAGYNSYYLASVEMYHFERQSMNQVAEDANARFNLNASIHAERWGRVIDEVMSAHG